MNRVRINRPSALPSWAIHALQAVGAPPHPMWLYVEIGSPDECWPFVGAHKIEGYGRTSEGGKLVLAHRLSHCLSHGLDLLTFNASGLMVRHTCDNPPCCNPRHLVEGTAADNVADKVRRGRARAPRGEHVSTALLTEAQVRQIKRRLAARELRRTLADEYGVSLSAIDSIKAGRNWAWVQE